mgnify:CR=1 FL=1
MHHQGRPAIPALDEFDEFDDVFLGRMRVTVEWRSDIVHPEDEMIADGDGGGPLDPVHHAQQCDHVAGAGFGDSIVQPGKGADVNHSSASLNHFHHIILS